MSKKKIFALICMFIFISWGIVSLYYYNKHVVTIKECNVGKKIEVSEGMVIIKKIEIHDFEANYVDYKKRKWLYDLIPPKIPVKLHMFALRTASFYNEPYNFNLGIDDNEGRIMYIYGIYASNKDKEMHDKIDVNVVEENGRYLTCEVAESMSSMNSNYKLFQFRGRFFLNEYSPAGDESLMLIVKDQLNDESHEIMLDTDWETKKYNFFNRPSGKYSFNPSKTANSLIKAVVYEKDLNKAEKLIHPEINNFPWERFKHEKWARSQERTVYIGDYLGFKDVFSTRITFRDSKAVNLETVKEQKIFLTDYNNEWKIIDISPLMKINESY